MSDTQLVTAAVVGIVTVVLLITWLRVHPFFSHVNDAGFWLVKEYFGLSLGETLKTWAAMETIISVVGLAGVLLLRALV